MTDYTTIDFTPLYEVSDDEVVTHAYVRDIPLASGRTLALITLDNGEDHRRPNTFGPLGLRELDAVLEALRARGAAGEIDAIGITGKPFILAAGADLSRVNDIPSREVARLLPQLGHHVFGKLDALGVPSFAFINGLALGGGLEIGLNSSYRTVDAGTSAIALPEVFLGLIPGWGGAYLLPNLIGIENALEVVISNPLKMNRMLDAARAHELGIVDAIFPAATFLEDSLRWADAVLEGRTRPERANVPGKVERLVKWDAAIAIARKTLESRIGTVPVSPYRALDLLKAAKSGTKEDAFAREDEVLAELIAGEQFRASVYAFDLVQRRTKRPAGAPDKTLARKVTKVGVIGAGLMATQFAFLFLRRLRVPVVITDLDKERVDRGVETIRGEIDALAAKGRLSPDDANRLHALVHGTTDRVDFADCDFVIEAVFEELGVKQEVFSDIERHVSETAVLATNTSSLSVERIGERLAHPERLVGFHFFNPVAVMPLIEVVRTPQVDDEVIATAMAVAKELKKNAVITKDTPGFVVNRVLAKLLGEAMRAVDAGTSFADVDAALQPLGLPMPPSQLLDLVGLTVGAHVLDTHAAAFPDRFYASESLRRLAEYGTLLQKDAKGRVTGFDRGALTIVSGGTSPVSKDEILRRVQDGLADEVHRMLEDGVVGFPEDIDLCLILGAGYPFQMGGVTPYLDRTGASERVFGDTFHHPPMLGLS